METAREINIGEDRTRNIPTRYSFFLSFFLFLLSLSLPLSRFSYILSFFFQKTRDNLCHVFICKYKNDNLVINITSVVYLLSIQLRSYLSSRMYLYTALPNAYTSLNQSWHFLVNYNTSYAQTAHYGRSCKDRLDLKKRSVFIETYENDVMFSFSWIFIIYLLC